MSPTTNSFHPTVQPFAPSSFVSRSLDVCCGVVFAGLIWSIVQFGVPSGSALVFPLLLVAHAITGALLVWGGREYLCSARQRRLLTQVPMPRGDDSAVDSSVWSAAMAECHRTMQMYKTYELPHWVFTQSCSTWMDSLTSRYSIGLILATIPLFLGLFQGMDQLRLSTDGAYLAGFSQVYFPLIVTTVEALVCAGVFAGWHVHWHHTLIQWKDAATKSAWDCYQEERAKIEKQEELAREAEAKLTKHGGGTADHATVDSGSKVDDHGTAKTGWEHLPNHSNAVRARDRSYLERSEG